MDFTRFITTRLLLVRIGRKKLTSSDMKAFIPKEFGFMFFLFIGISLMSVYRLNIKRDDYSFETLLLSIGVIFIFYLVCGNSCNRIFLDERQIEIVNLWYFWRKRKQHHLSTIERIEFLTPARQSFFLRIVLIGGKRDSYYSQLSHEQIQLLARELKSVGVTVVDKMTAYRLS
jgi:hypothetical protein